jgi:hypothetical protein
MLRSTSSIIQLEVRIWAWHGQLPDLGVRLGLILAMDEGPVAKWGPSYSSTILVHRPSTEVVADTSRALLAACQVVSSVRLDVLLCSADDERYELLLPGWRAVRGPFGNILSRARSFSIAVMLCLGVTSPLVYLPRTYMPSLTSP